MELKSVDGELKLRLVKYYQIISIAVFICSISFAQKIENIGIENGLSSHRAYDVVQDKHGFIWVSTLVGIDRFDGENVINYTLPEVERLRSFNRISLVNDKEKNVWAFTNTGEIYCFIEGENAFKLILNVSDLLSRSISLSKLIIEDRIWVATFSGLYTYNINENKLSLIPTYKNKSIPIIAKYTKGQILVDLLNRLEVYDTLTGISYPLDNYQNEQNITEIRAIFYDKTNDEIWIGLLDGGIHVYNCETSKFLKLNEHIPELPLVPVRDIVSTDNTVFIGYDGGGIYKIEKEHKVLINHYKEDEDKPKNLNGNGIQDLCVDKSGNLWATSYTGGLNILNQEKPQFKIIQHEINNPNSLSNNVVTNILEDRDGDFWFATNNGVSCWLKSKDKWVHYLRGQESNGNVFLCLAQFDDNKIMAGSYSKGIFVIDKIKGVTAHILPSQDNTKYTDSADYISEIYFDNEHKMWAAGPHKETAVYNPASGTYQYLPILAVNSMVTKDKDHIFIGTSAGLFEVNIYTFEFHKVNFNKFPSKDFFRVNCLQHDQKNSILWIATQGSGVFKWNIKTDKLQQFSTKEGLPSNFIDAILQDQDKGIWASTEKGLVKINLSDGRIESYSKKDGLSDESFYKDSKLRAANGDIYIGSYHGVTSFNPKDIKPRNDDVTIFLSQLSINNNIVHINDEDSPLKSSLNDTKELSLHYNKNSFSIGFTSITSINTGEILYSTLLEGQDAVWTIPTSNNIANYTNLSEGKYTFKLRAIGNRNKEVLDERMLEIIVKPAPWNTVGAWVAYLVLLVSVLFAVLRYVRLSDLKRLSDSKIKFFINTAHDIRTPLTLASAPLSDLQKSEFLSDQDKYHLGLSVSNLGKLNEMVNSLLDFQKSDLGKNQLVVSKVDIPQIIEERIAYFSSIAERKNIKVNWGSELDELSEWIDQRKFEKIIDNLLSNAFKYTHNNGSVRLTLSATKKNWNIIIQDTGIGIPKESQKNIFKRFYRGENAVNSATTGTGIGLLLAHNYVLLHQGKIEFDSSEGMGTKFMLSFLRGKTHFQSNVIIKEVPEKVKINQTQEPLEQIIPAYDHESTGKKKLKILVVEDNDNLRNYLKNSLKRMYLIQTAENGKVALEQINKTVPDLIVSDIGMPEMDGIELTNYVKSQYETSHIPIILLTAFTEKEDILKGLKTGADDYITKPFDTSILLIRIENVLKTRQMLRTRFLELTENKLEENSYTNNKDQEFIQKAMTFVENNIDNPSISRQYFAQEMFVSQTVLYQKLKTLTDQSPTEFVRVIKLRHAAKLLKGKDNSVAEVASLTGFSDPKYFSTCFKKLYGKSPSSF